MRLVTMPPISPAMIAIIIRASREWLDGVGLRARSKIAAAYLRSSTGGKCSLWVEGRRSHRSDA
jgi:hypothetical protein